VVGDGITCERDRGQCPVVAQLHMHSTVPLTHYEYYFLTGTDAIQFRAGDSAEFIYFRFQRKNDLRTSQPIGYFLAVGRRFEQVTIVALAHEHHVSNHRVVVVGRESGRACSRQYIIRTIGIGF